MQHFVSRATYFVIAADNLSSFRLSERSDGITSDVPDGTGHTYVFILVPSAGGDTTERDCSRPGAHSDQVANNRGLYTRDLQSDSGGHSLPDVGRFHFRDRRIPRVGQAHSSVRHKHALRVFLIGGSYNSRYLNISTLVQQTVLHIQFINVIS